MKDRNVKQAMLGGRVTSRRGKVNEEDKGGLI
jgi:hypothetical protein